MGIRRAIVFVFIYIIFVLPCYAIKIGLQTEVGRTFIGTSTKGEIIDGHTNKLLFEMEKMIITKNNLRIQKT